MCTGLILFHSVTSAARAVGCAVTPPCSLSAGEPDSATAAPATTPDGSTHDRNPNKCRCLTCEAEFKTPLELVEHWNAEHRASWIAKHTPPPHWAYLRKVRLSVGLPLVDLEVVG